jgi:hypothetical protein
MNTHISTLYFFSIICFLNLKTFAQDNTPEIIGSWYVESKKDSTMYLRKAEKSISETKIWYRFNKDGNLTVNSFLAPPCISEDLFIIFNGRWSKKSTKIYLNYNYNNSFFKEVWRVIKVNKSQMEVFISR